ncbi:MAG: type II secretion system GspH family protein [Blastocatellia bacterium]|nr:type II secretion system GspH family protein [Blastocatellia bacterium]
MWQFLTPLAKKHSRFHSGRNGFTIIELTIVISILMILMAMSIPIYRSMILHAKETVLRDNLHKMRQAIDNYTNDKDGAPPTLQDLVKAKYFREVPLDPITGSNQTWQVKLEEEASGRSGRIGIRDVFSGSQAISSDGTPYNEW